jgi:hypothetical protein
MLKRLEKFQSPNTLFSMEISLYPIGKVIKFQSPYALFSMRIPSYCMEKLKIFLSPTLKKYVLIHYKIKY